MIEKVARAIHDARFHALTPENAEKRWKLIHGTVEHRMYQRQARAAMEVSR